MSWNRTFIALIIAEGLAIVGFSTSMPTIPDYLKEIGLTTTAGVNFWNGLIQASAAAALAIFAPVWGSLADHFGRKKMLLRAMFGGSVIVGMMAFVTAPWQLWILRILQGCVTGTVGAATALVSSNAPPKKTGFYLGNLQTAIYTGSALGPLVGGLVWDNFGHRVNFLITGTLLLAAGFIVAYFVEDRFTPAPGRKSILRNAVPDFSFIRSDSRIISLLSIVFTVQLAGSVINPILPLYIDEILHSGSMLGTTTGIILSVGAVASAAAAFSVSMVIDRLGYRKTLMICLTGAVLFYIPQGLIRTWQELLALRIADGIFLGGMIPSVNALLSSMTPPEKRGSVFGVNSSVASTGAALGPALGAAAATFFGYRSIFFITSTLIAISGIAIFSRKMPRTVSSDSSSGGGGGGGGG